MKKLADYQAHRTAHAAAWDAGNRSMCNAERDKWSADDYNAAIREYSRLRTELER